MAQIITTNSGGGGGTGVYTYKGSVNTYEDLPSTGLKVGDVYNVVNAHTTAPVFPAGSNLAWTGTEWDVLGGDIDLSDYQKKLTEGTGIDIDGDTNEISVESSIVNGAAAGATAVQPGDDISDLNNDAGYITGIDSSDITTALGYTPYDSANPSGYITSSSVKNGTLTIQKNGTNVQTFSANQSSNATANISVPTDTSDLTNNAGFITSSAVKDGTLTIQKNGSTIDTFSANSASNVSVNITVPTAVTDLSDASNYQTVGNLVTNLTSPDNTHYPSAKAVADAITSSGGGDMLASVYDPDNIAANAFDYDNFINTPTIPGVIDNLTSTSTTDALSANQGKELKDLIDTYVGLGRFLSLWNSKTGQPISFPLTTPYTYNTGDWFMVEIVDTTTNYMPNGSSYTGAASTTVDSTNNVEVRDVYIYDGTDWLFQKNNEIQVSFSDIAGSPSDNAALDSALDAKADASSLATVATSGDYGDLLNKPTIGTATLTIQKNGATVDTFGANATSNKTINITVPTKVSDLSNDSGFVTNQVDDTAYASSWNGVTNKAPSKNAVYDKIESVVGSIPTVNDATLTIQKNGTTVNTFTANASSNVTANITVPTDTGDLTNGAGFVTNQVSDTAYGAGWDGDTTTAPSKNAVYDKISAMDTTISGKQAALATQTAYTSKGTATKVPTITTNTLGQVTGITETNITFPVTSVNGSTGAVTVSEFTPSGTATTGYVVTKTAGGYEWAAPSGGGDVQISSQANNILTSGTKLRAGTQANYDSLGSYSNDTIYLTI